MQTNQPDILTDKKERNDFYIALITIFLTGIFITQTSLISQDEAVSQKTIYTSDIKTDTDEYTSTYITEEKEIERPSESSVAPIRKRAAVTPPTYHANKSVPIEKAIISKAVASETQEVKNKLSDMATEVHEEVTEVISEVKEAGTEIIEEIKSETADINEEVQEEGREEMSVEINQAATEIQEEAKAEIQVTKAVLSSALDKTDLNKKDCVIAIGLYEEAKNVSNLSSRLESEGYDVFTKNLRRLTQVGVYISCDPTMSKSVLSEIQEIYAKDAFIVER